MKLLIVVFCYGLADMAGLGAFRHGRLWNGRKGMPGKGMDRIASVSIGMAAEERRGRDR